MAPGCGIFPEQILTNDRQSAPRLPDSLWAATAIGAPAYGRLDADRVCDVAIVGGGYTGLSAALHLARAGLGVIVAEAAEPGWGASGRNGGQIIAGLKTNPQDLIAAFGDDLGLRLALRMGGAADLVFDLVERYGMDCAARRSGWVQAAHGAKPLRKLIEPRCRQWSALGVAMQMLDRRQVAALLGSDPSAYVGGFRDPRGGVLQPLSYARGLAAAAIKEGAAVLAQAPVHCLRREGARWSLSAGGHTIKAAQVILATNAYSGAFGARLWPNLDRTVIPVTSFQMATPPLSGEAAARIIPGGEGVTDSRRLLLYFRRDHTGRLVMGGRSPVEDWPRQRDAAPLQAAVARIFPEFGRPSIEHVWTGKVAITKDKMPHIHMPEPGLMAFMGCNGRGVAVCTMMGALLADLATGTAPGDLAFPVTAPDTFALHGLRKLGVFAVSQYYRLLDRIDTFAAG
jgi:glycine/D-amino acid oxidase-like deaminating enzyme